MTKAYYIENKNYYQDENGTDHQVADGGDLPILYTSRKKALGRVDKMIKLLSEKMGYKVVIPNESYPGVGDNYIYACRLFKESHNLRLELRIYPIHIY